MHEAGNIIIAKNLKNYFKIENGKLKLKIPGGVLKWHRAPFETSWSAKKHLMLPGQIWEAKRELIVEGEELTIEKGMKICIRKTFLRKGEHGCFPAYCCDLVKEGKLIEAVEISNEYFAHKYGFQAFRVIEGRAMHYYKSNPPILSRVLKRIK